MKKLNTYQLNKVKKNLIKFFNLASNEDLKNGKNWYIEAYKICQDIAQKYNTNTFIAASVISALSPRNKWHQNIKDAYTVFDAVKNNIEPENVKVCTFHSNKFKAFQLAKSEIQITDSSLKTYNFVNNIALLSKKHVTVDIWHLRACFDKIIQIDKAKIGRIAYGQIKDITLQVSEKLGISGYELQAIVWLSVQKNYKL
jgi:hypothetical protein